MHKHEFGGGRGARLTKIQKKKKIVPKVERGTPYIVWSTIVMLQKISHAYTERADDSAVFFSLARFAYTHTTRVFEYSEGFTCRKA